MGFLKSIGIKRRHNPSEHSLERVPTNDIFEELLDRLRCNVEDKNGALPLTHSNNNKNHNMYTKNHKYTAQGKQKETDQSARSDKSCDPFKIEDDDVSSFYKALKNIVYDDDDDDDDDENENEEEYRDDEDDKSQSRSVVLSRRHDDEQSSSATSAAAPFLSFFLNAFVEKLDISCKTLEETGIMDPCVCLEATGITDQSYMDREIIATLDKLYSRLEDTGSMELKRLESNVTSNIDDSEIFEESCSNCAEDMKRMALAMRESQPVHPTDGNLRPVKLLPLVIRNNDRRNVIAWARCAARNRSQHHQGNGPNTFPIARPLADSPPDSLAPVLSCTWCEDDQAALDRMKDTALH